MKVGIYLVVRNHNEEVAEAYLGRCKAQEVDAIQGALSDRGIDLGGKRYSVDPGRQTYTIVDLWEEYGRSGISASDRWVVRVYLYAYTYT